MRIFFSVGEPSGDLHGANLIRALRRQRGDVECVGYGGPEMAAAGCVLHEDLTQLAVMWFLRVLLNLHRFLHLVSRADRYFRHHRPDAVVLIDYPGFNWWIARRAKAHGIPVFYYSPPQIWAWGSWRVKKMRRYVDYVLCGLPFEEAWFRQHGCHATFVGHPYFDEVRRQQLDMTLVAALREADGPLVTILPGSRNQEIEHNLGWFLKAAAVVRARVPQVRFAIAAYKPRQGERARALVADAGFPVDVYVGRTPELIEAADCCMAVSGSVSLELLYRKKPTVVLYYISRLAYWVQGFFRHARYITLVNLLAAKEPLAPAGKVPSGSAPGEPLLFPEYLTCEDRSLAIAAHVVSWLVNDQQREERIAELAKLKAQVAHGGASRTAAGYIVGQLEARPARPPRPHFLPGMVVQSSGEPPRGEPA